MHDRQQTGKPYILPNAPLSYRPYFSQSLLLSVQQEPNHWTTQQSCTACSNPVMTVTPRG